ncbi:MAG: ATP-binding protein [Acidobacteriota bacterium]
MSTRPRNRNEISLLVFCALLLLVGLSSFQLIVLRDTVNRLYDERVTQAEKAARLVAGRLVDRPWPSSTELRQFMPSAESMTIYDAADRPVASTGGESDFAAGANTIVGEWVLKRRDGRYRVEVRLRSPVLSARKKSLSILTPLVIGVDVGVLLIMVAFVRRWLQPLDRLVERARAVGSPADEIPSLMRTFERALEEMTEPEDGLRALEGALVRSMQSGVLLMDRAGTVLALNEVGAEILRIEDEIPAEGADLEAVLADHPNLGALLQGALDGEAAVFRQECGIEVEGQRRDLGLTAHPLRKDEDDVQGWLVMFADLTDVKKRLADERLSENLRQIGELTAGVAHEMRNGLATLKGYLALMERAGPDSVDSYVQEIRQETDHLHRVVEDFLDFARPGSVRMQEVDMKTLLLRIAADPARLDDETMPSVETRFDERLGSSKVQGDPTLLTRAISNLVINAQQAQSSAPVQDPLVIGLSSDSVAGVEGLLIRIEDRGPGIPESLRPKLFDAFVSGRSDGVGLGLPLARRIVLLHGGEIRLEDRRGGGTVALVFLPAGNIVTDGSNIDDSE